MEMISTIARSLICGAAILTGIAATAQSPVHLTPEPGEVTELSEFLISFDGDWALGYARSAKFTVTGPEGVEIPKVMSYSLGASVGYMVYFEDDAVITAPGTYTLTIPAAKFEVNNQELPEMSFEYVITEEGAANRYSGSVSIDPREGTYTSIDMFTIAYEGEVELLDEEGITIDGPEGEVTLYAEAMDNTIIVVPMNLDRELNEPGAYTLSIAKDAVSVDGKTVGAMTFDYIIEDGSAKFPKYHISPFPGLYDTIESAFRLEFATEEAVTISKSSVWLSGPNGDIDLTVTVPQGANYVEIQPVDTEGNAIKLEDKGTYTLIITMGAVHVGDLTNDEPLVFVYTILGATGIDSVETDDADAEIYTTSGIRVRQPARGIYIINGKKIVK